MNNLNFNIPISTFIPFHFGSNNDDDRKESPENRPQRDEHKKDEAIEEFVDPDPNAKPGKKDKPEKDDKMGRSKEAEEGPSDERDRYKND
ncbi:hypothetical protein KIH41_17480 [Litoribacter ruber]|uniref:Uncharacterized protein n=1 Tax=Litoribacter ruber TaxID=702568 RepID=A0AAP2CJR0_9BACT|nr:MULTISPECIES: hypothetical protein [Litoribacter]MBS9525452.1 hypothetical protein [Litoribacter alkaliphilus]MBT0813084.1 hypothetical protein [Litoribacter ruber]